MIYYVRPWHSYIINYIVIMFRYTRLCIDIIIAGIP